MFTSTLKIAVIGNGKYRLLEPMQFIYDSLLITVYDGFEYDGASVPKDLWEEIGCPSDFLYESLFHDALYASKLLDRKTCDKIFHRLLTLRGVNAVKAKAMYLAVRVAGESHYGKGSIANAREYVKVDILK